MRRVLPLLVALPLVLSAGPTTTTTTQVGPSTNRAEPRARVEAAAAVLKAVEDRVRGAAVSDTWVIEQTARWSKRLMLAELDAASTPDEREKAAEQYLARVINLSGYVHRISAMNVGRTDLASVNYHIIEAGEILACVRTGKRLPSTCD